MKKSTRYAIPWLALALIAMLALAGCMSDSDDDDDAAPASASYGLVLVGDSTFGTIHPDGRTVYLRVVDTATGVAAGTGTYTQVISAAGFTFSLPGILTAGQSYQADYFVDLGTAGACVTGEGHYWRKTTGAVTADVTLNATHSETLTDVCATFP